MRTFDSILVAAEHGSVGLEAVRRAAALAQRHGARLWIVALPARARWPWRRGSAAPVADAPHGALHDAAQRQALQQLAVQLVGRDRVAELAAGARGEPLDILLRAAAQADLVVIGQAALGWVGAWWGGATVRALARRCPRPLLVVRKPGAAPYLRVLMPMALQACEQAAVRVASRVAAEGGLHLFHAIEPIPLTLAQRLPGGEAALRQARARARAAAHARLRRTVWRSGLERSTVNYTVSLGPPLRSARRHARRIAADLLVHQRRPGECAALTATALRRRGLAGSDCDVLIVPSPGTADGAQPRAGMAQTPSWLHGAAALPARRSS